VSRAGGIGFVDPKWICALNRDRSLSLILISEPDHRFRRVISHSVISESPIPRPSALTGRGGLPRERRESVQGATGPALL
jgi:hypothetical protein